MESGGQATECNDAAVFKWPEMFLLHYELCY